MIEETSRRVRSLLSVLARVFFFYMFLSYSIKNVIFLKNRRSRALVPLSSIAECRRNKKREKVRKKEIMEKDVPRV